MTKTALVEVSTSHEECFYSQARFMQNTEFELDLYIHPNLNSQIAPYQGLFKNIFFAKEESGLFKKLWSSIQLVKKLKNYDLIIFNTASSSKLIRNTIFLLNLYPKTKCIGLLHNTKKLESSFTQKIISTKIKQYFVLADHLVKSPSRKIKLESFYPIYFPKIKTSIVKKENEIWIVIPGRIDFSRRNYTLLSNALEKVSTLTNVRFIFLGKLLETTKDGKTLLLEFKKSAFFKKILFFDYYIENEEYQAYLSSADFIMPLLKSDSSYLNHKISGSFNLAYAYEKPILTQDFFMDIPDFSEHAIFFHKDNLHLILEELDKRNLKHPAIKQLDKWSFENQKKNYLNFLRLTH